MNETVWTDGLNEKLQKEFNFNFDLPAVFIDSFHNREKPDEVDKFSQNTQMLWSFAQSKLGINRSVNKSIFTWRIIEIWDLGLTKTYWIISDEPFNCTDIQPAMSDLRSGTILFRANGLRSLKYWADIWSFPLIKIVLSYLLCCL